MKKIIDTSKEELALQAENELTGCHRTSHWHKDHMYAISDIGGTKTICWVPLRYDYDCIPKTNPDKVSHNLWVGWFPTLEEAEMYITKYLSDRSAAIFEHGPRFDEGFSGAVYLLNLDFIRRKK